MDFLVDFWRFMRVRKKFWLLPVFAVLLLLGFLLTASQGAIMIPLLYALF